MERARKKPGPVAIDLGTSEEAGRRVERFELTAEARGPWSDDAAHGGAPAALLARSAEGWGRAEKMRLAGLSTVFYGPVSLGEIGIESRVVKPGRRQQVIALTVTGEGRVLVETRAVLLRRGSVDLPEARPDPESDSPLGIPGQGREVDQRRWAMSDGPAFHRTANTVLAVEGGPDRVGEIGSAWFRLEAPLLEGEPASGAQRAVAAADFGNGVAHPVPFGEYLFANPDLSVSLLREPVGSWIGIRARTDFHGGGAGVTSTELFDAEGRVGAAVQTLYVDRA